MLRRLLAFSLVASASCFSTAAEPPASAPAATPPAPVPAVVETPATAAAPAVATPTPSPAPAAAPRISVNHCNVEGPYIAITFDDGPHGVQTPRLLKMLRDRGIRATFFLVGQCV